jgi:hypothetical protein
LFFGFKGPNIGTIGKQKKFWDSLQVAGNIAGIRLMPTILEITANRFSVGACGVFYFVAFFLFRHVGPIAKTDIVFSAGKKKRDQEEVQAMIQGATGDHFTEQVTSTPPLTGCTVDWLHLSSAALCVPDIV